MKIILDSVKYYICNCLMIIMLIIVGQAGGNHYSNKGGGSNYLCLPNDPDNGKPYSYANDVLYGVEYDAPVYPTGFPNVYQKEASCAVCRRKGKSSVLMIPGIRFSTQTIIFLSANNTKLGQCEE